MYLFSVKLVAVVLLIIEGSQAATKTKCQVVSALRAQGVPNSDLRDWLCLVKHESEFKYDVKNVVNIDGSKDYGIYELNDRYWCDRPNGNTEYPCWKLNTYGCSVSCRNLLNSDISDDTKCAVRIKNCNSFDKWVGWKRHCKDKPSYLSGSEFDYSDC